MEYLAVLGRQPEISIAELEALFGKVQKISEKIAIFDAKNPKIERLGGSLKLAQKLDKKPLEYLANLPNGKITLGVSDYSRNASRKTAVTEALKFKKILVRHKRSVRVVENKEAMLSTAASLHNGLSGKNERKIEFIKLNNDWYKVIGVQDIDAYTKRDQARPARDAFVGMLPPKLAQILINLCGPLPADSVVLDPFCGTGVVLQEALLMGYKAYGTDLSERMVEYTEKNLSWLIDNKKGTLKTIRDNGSGMSKEPHNDGRDEASPKSTFLLSNGDATSFQWIQPINAIACEGYLGKPFSKIPTGIELKEQKQECKSIVLGFLKNLANQIKPDTPVTIAIPAWLQENDNYERLEILDDINKMGYNVENKSREGLLYHRANQVVARDIIILRKK